MKVDLGNLALGNETSSEEAVRLRPAQQSTPASFGEPLVPLSPLLSCGAAYDRFQSEPCAAALAVVQSGYPLGLVNRHELFLMLASPYGRALFAEKPVGVMMDRAPLIVERSIDIDRLESLIIAEQPTALERGFIVTDEGRYVGIGSALSVMRLSIARTAQRNRELERTKEEAESASRTKSQFLANMSHELRTPLNAIIGFAELMQMQAEVEKISPRVLDYIQDIRSSGLHLLSIINDVLDMAKIESGRMELNETVVNVSELVERSMRLVRDRAIAGGIALRVNIGQHTPGLWADERIMQQILLNLLTNAIKFTPSKGRVTISAGVLESGELTLTVADTGIGIAPDHLSTVLQPFHQIANEYSRRHAGTGLGLSLVNAFVQMHDAQLEIASAVGSGTSIHIRFPTARLVRAPFQSP